MLRNSKLEKRRSGCERWRQNDKAQAGRLALCAALACVVFVPMAASGETARQASRSQSIDPIPVKSSPDASTPDFSLQLGATALSLDPGITAVKLAIVASPIDAFAGDVTLTVGALPKGVTASPAKTTAKAGTLALIEFAAAANAPAAQARVTLTAKSGTLTHTATIKLTVTAPRAATSAALSATAFRFGDNLVNNTIAHTVAVVSNTGAQPLVMHPTISGDPGFAFVAGQGCGTRLAAGASCDVVLKYRPQTASSPKEQTAVVDMGFVGVAVQTPEKIALSGTSGVLAAGKVTATQNPQVALYTMTLPFPGSVTVRYGQTVAYGHKTWAQSTDEDNGTVGIFVAGMLESKAYHMQATVEFANGVTVRDADHLFTAGPLPNDVHLKIATATAPGMTPQPGLELLNPLSGAMITDLEGDVLWAYRNPGGVTDNTTTNFVDGVKMLPNGDVLLVVGPTSNEPILATIPASDFIEIREVNLGGDTVKEISLDDLNWELKTATCAECRVTLANFHHDVTALPNGHWLVLSNTVKSVPDNGKNVSVLGDVIVDLDENLQPVWVWNEFNHLDVNRRPENFPDWTHTNALVYSPDDGNLIVSIRHQNWVLKVDYANGTGSGDVLWRLGYQGDFKLIGGVDPTDWQYAQHGPAFFSKNTSGVFSLGVMDNGEFRRFLPGVKCDAAGEPACQYSTVPIYQIDEKAKTATLTFHKIAPVKQFNAWGGNVNWLANGHVEYDLCGTTSGSFVYEVTRDSAMKTVWSMTVSNTNLYRASRIDGFYPGVPW